MTVTAVGATPPTPVAHIVRTPSSDHTLCGIAVSERTRCVLLADAPSSRGRLCAQCVSRFHRIGSAPVRGPFGRSRR